MTTPLTGRAGGALSPLQAPEALVRGILFYQAPFHPQEGGRHLVGHRGGPTYHMRKAEVRNDPPRALPSLSLSRPTTVTWRVENDLPIPQAGGRDKGPRTSSGHRGGPE